MKVEQINVGNALRNFVYVLYNEPTRQAWVIDPYDAKQVANFLDAHQYKLEMVINTHLHFDHTKGNEELLKKYNSKLWDIHNPDDIELTPEWKLEVRKSPGHTMEHVVFALVNKAEQKGFFGGDTLFHNGVGNCKNGGKVEVLYETIQDLKSWVNPSALFYTGHDYGLSNLEFSLSHKPLEVYKKEVERLENSSTRVFPFDRELKTNIFLNVDREDFIELRKKRDNW